ncbi:CAAD domain-containing protein [Moorena sp. SIO3H5]|uniref:CAAD domain-containing protein n=1 Tax=Moorena sp. SIO3H5 TaxID=2607834 RepID=UPI0013B81EC6|nr:CAAD domain-containing protein [Moorena sp. SIO3H5]NEO68009.1 hypothetical protein [Moorena sp. SIO3H5]
MESNPQASAYTQSSTSETTLEDQTQLKVDLKVDKPGAIAKLTAPEPGLTQPWQEWLQTLTDIVSQLPEYIGAFVSNYQKPLLTLGLLLAGFITVKITLAVLDAINDIPLMAPLFELVGIGYTIWFVARYLLKVETRQELSGEIQSLKGQFIAKK